MKPSSLRLLWPRCTMLCAPAAAAVRITTVEMPSPAPGRSLPVAVVAPETVSPCGDGPGLFLPARVHWLEGGHEFTLVERAVSIVLADATGRFWEGER